MWDASKKKTFKENVERDNERSRRERIEAADKNTEPLSLWPDQLKAAGADRDLVQIEMRLGALRVGTVIVNGRAGGILWIADIWVFDGLRRRGYGKAAIDALMTMARSEGYGRLAGEVEYGPREEVGERRAFFSACGFIVNEDRSMEMDLTATAS